VNIARAGDPVSRHDRVIGDPKRRLGLTERRSAPICLSATLDPWARRPRAYQPL